MHFISTINKFRISGQTLRPLLLGERAAGEGKKGSECKAASRLVGHYAADQGRKERRVAFAFLWCAAPAAERDNRSITGEFSGGFWYKFK